jgi:Ulp1 protease family, C-terminal catalytic domain
MDCPPSLVDDDIEIVKVLVPVKTTPVNSMWFASEHIDFYFRNHAELANERYVSPVDCNAMLNSRTRVKRFIGLEKQDMKACNFLFCPFNVRNAHWVLYGVLVEERVAFLFDPLEESGLKRESRAMGRTLHEIVNKFLFDGLLEFDNECVPKFYQTNDHDCGPFVCVYAAGLVENGIDDSPVDAVRQVREFVELMPGNESASKLIGGGPEPLDNSLQEYLSFTEDHFSAFISSYTVSHRHLTVKPIVATAISKGNASFLRKQVSLNIFDGKEYIYLPVLIDNRRWVLFVADLIHYDISVLDPTTEIIDESLLQRMRVTARYIEHLCLIKRDMRINVFGQSRQLVQNGGQTGLMVCGYVRALMEERPLFDIDVKKLKKQIAAQLIRAKKKSPTSSVKQKENHTALNATRAARVEKSMTFTEIRSTTVDPDTLEKDITMYIYSHRPVKRRNLYMGSKVVESTNQDPSLRKLYRVQPKKTVQVILNNTIADTTPSTEAIIEHFSAKSIAPPLVNWWILS